MKKLLNILSKTFFTILVVPFAIAFGLVYGLLISLLYCIDTIWEDDV